MKGSRLSTALSGSSTRKRVWVPLSFIHSFMAVSLMLIGNQLSVVNHIFDSAGETPPGDPPASTSSATAPEDNGISDPTSSQASRAVRSQPSLDSETMVDVALMTIMHEGLPTLPPLSDLTDMLLSTFSMLSKRPAIGSHILYYMSSGRLWCVWDIIP
jgi:hypothetical protein